MVVVLLLCLYPVSSHAHFKSDTDAITIAEEVVKRSVTDTVDHSVHGSDTLLRQRYKRRYTHNNNPNGVNIRDRGTMWTDTYDNRNRERCPTCHCHEDFQWKVNLLLFILLSVIIMFTIIILWLCYRSK